MSFAFAIIIIALSDILCVSQLISHQECRLVEVSQSKLKVGTVWSCLYLCNLYPYLSASLVLVIVVNTMCAPKYVHYITCVHTHTHTKKSPIFVSFSYGFDKQFILGLYYSALVHMSNPAS